MSRAAEPHGIPVDAARERRPLPRLPLRLRREQRTVAVMIQMYCRAHHAGAVEGRPGPAVPCPACSTLVDYSSSRIDACRFGADKPTCVRCTVHCFRPEQREQIRTVMRYSGPRMTIRHPYLAFRHLLDRHHTPGAAA